VGSTRSMRDTTPSAVRLWCRLQLESRERRQNDHRNMTAKRLALTGLICLVGVVAYTAMFPRLVATGHQPPAAVGWTLELVGIGLLVASLLVAIIRPAGRR
jgi:hypothetical protein